MNSVTYYDYRFKFLIGDLLTAVTAFDALRAASLLDPNSLPMNMLGGPIDDATGKVVAIGAKGVAASSFVDPMTSQVTNSPARGDPAYYYVFIRSTISPDKIPFDPATYKLIVCDPVESKVVLGNWE